MSDDSYIGKLISDRYIITSFLGRGAFGTVYQARDKLLSRDCVVKIFDQNFLDNDRYLREARISDLSHPNIVSLIDFGILPDVKIPYTISEYVNGKSLQELLDNKQLSFRDGLEVGKAVAIALQYIHNQNIVHRDIKPSNILVPNVETGYEFKNTKLTDFGLSGSLINRTTPSGELFGTPYFMSPEQLKAVRQTTASDIYSFGVLLFEILSRKSLFSAESIGDLYASKLTWSRESLPSNDLPKELRDFILACLETDIEKRPTAIEVTRFLGTFSLSKDVSSEVYGSLATDNWTPNRSFIAMAALGITIPVWWVWGSEFPIIGLITGCIFGVAGIILSRSLRRWLENRHGVPEKTHEKLISEGKSRDELTDSLAIQIDDYFGKMSQPGDKILYTSLAFLITELKEAGKTGDRQEALMKAVTIMEKLTPKVSPSWYVRNEKLLTVMVMVIGLASAFVTITATVVKLLAKTPN